MDGVLGMDLSPYVPGEDRKLFYHAMSSNTENWVYTSDLRNQSRFMHDPTSSPEVFHVSRIWPKKLQIFIGSFLQEFKGRRPSQSAAEAIDANGICYFGVMHETEIDCWNTETEYGPNNIDTLERNPTTLQFPSGIKVTPEKNFKKILLIFFVILIGHQQQQRPTGALGDNSPLPEGRRRHSEPFGDQLQDSGC